MAIGTLSQFSPPAKLEDFEKADLPVWDATVNRWIELEIAGEPGGVPRTTLPQFFNPKKTKYERDQTPVPITWIGFPLKLRMTKPTDDARWRAAENPKNQVNPRESPVQKPGSQDIYLPQDREMMDEYLEWSTQKCKKTGDVLIASFTCEGPEYWTELAKQYPVKSKYNPKGSDKILNIYKEVNPDFADQIKAEDLVDEDTGVYNTRNKWNGFVDTGTIAHLIQDNNALSAEVDIAAQATVLRKDLTRGKLITNVIELCGHGSSYGNTRRNSDPTIGGEVNTLARLGVRISIADPIALYMHAADFSSFRLDPTGLRRGDVDEMVPWPEQTFSFLRGDIAKGWGLHLKVRIPGAMKATHPAAGGRPLNVSDLYDLNNGGQYVRYGSQFADYVTMSVSGIVAHESLPAPAPMQDSLTYTEPFEPVPFDDNVNVKAVAEKARKERRSGFCAAGVEQNVSSVMSLPPLELSEFQAKVKAKAKAKPQVKIVKRC